jgi:hypothetical protein
MTGDAKHFDDGKPELQYLLEMDGLEEVAACGTHGQRKYGDRYNFKKGMNWMKLLGSCSRHLRAFIKGEEIDPESGRSHLAHLIYDALMLLDYTKNKEHRSFDDRYSTLKDQK